MTMGSHVADRVENSRRRFNLQVEASYGDFATMRVYSLGVASFVNKKAYLDIVGNRTTATMMDLDHFARQSFRGARKKGSYK
jgi:hypothetical protein